MLNHRSYVIVLLLAIAALSGSAFAKSSSDRVQFGRDIHVQPGESTGDLVCIGCSIYVRGEGAGDAVAVGGSIVLEGAEVNGDAVAVGGSLHLNGSAHVGGDAVAVLGSVHRDADASIGGSITSLGGPLWFLLIVFLPLAMFGGFIALIVWLFQRNRRPASDSAYAGGAPITRV
jgi:hypothetical protein